MDEALSDVKSKADKSASELDDLWKMAMAIGKNQSLAQTDELMKKAKLEKLKAAAKEKLEVATTLHVAEQRQQELNQ